MACPSAPFYSGATSRQEELERTKLIAEIKEWREAYSWVEVH